MTIEHGNTREWYAMSEQATTNKPNGLRMPPADGRKPSPKELRQSTPLLPLRTTAITTNCLSHRPPRFTMPRAMSCRDAMRMRQLDVHYRAIYLATSRDDYLPQSIPISNANPRSAATPANQRIRNAILPTHTEWTTTAIGSPLATPMNFARCFPPKCYKLCCGVSHQSSTTLC